MQPFELRSRLYFVTPAGVAGGRSLRDLVQAAVDGGVGMVAYGRDGGPTRELVDEASELVRVARRDGLPFIVNGRVDVAMAVTADGVHVGPGDMPVAIARRMMGPGAIVGVTVASLADALEAAREGASYVAVSPLCRLDMPSGECAELLQELAAANPLPLCGPAGPDPGAVPSTVAASCALVAVSELLATSADPAALTRQLVAQLQA
jgi:thiamine-phosphate pyrophosphorylase